MTVMAIFFVHSYDKDLKMKVLEMKYAGDRLSMFVYLPDERSHSVAELTG